MYRIQYPFNLIKINSIPYIKPHSYEKIYQYRRFYIHYGTNTAQLNTFISNHAVIKAYIKWSNQSLNKHSESIVEAIHCAIC